MNADLFNHILHQPATLKDISTEELEQICYQYPWFAAGHFILAAKMKQTDHEAANQQLQKAALFSNQPLWFNQQMKRFEKQEHENMAEQPAALNHFANELQEFELRSETDEEKTANETDAVLDAETIIEAEERKEAQTSVLTDDIFNAQVLIEAEFIKEEEVLLKEADMDLDAKAIIEADLEKEETTAIVPVATKEKPVFTFEPFHTVDYFASQGIKLQESKMGDDKLGQQVKTFTQWLRSMKKIYVEEKKELDTNLEQAVVTMASESNQLTEVITETMADVLIKQGKLSQAIDLYRKLSLLHPEKSVYFASRIDELKQ